LKIILLTIDIYEESVSERGIMSPVKLVTLTGGHILTVSMIELKNWTSSWSFVPLV